MWTRAPAAVVSSPEAWVARCLTLCGVRRGSEGCPASAWAPGASGDRGLLADISGNRTDVLSHSSFIGRLVLFVLALSFPVTDRGRRLREDRSQRFRCSHLVLTAAWELNSDSPFYCPCTIISCPPSGITTPGVYPEDPSSGPPHWASLRYAVGSQGQSWYDVPCEGRRQSPRKV